MLQNYLLIAWRNLRQHRFYALLNGIGLAVGIGFALLVGAYVWGEWQVNRQLRHADRQCIVQSRWVVPEMGNELASLAPLGVALQTTYPTLVANCYRNYGVNAIVSASNQPFRAGILVGDTPLLTMFGLPLIHGDPATALRQPNSVVITAAIAQTYFGQTDVLNKRLTIQTPMGGKQAFTITGVLSDLPENSVTQLNDFAPQLFISLTNYRYFANPDYLNSWENQVFMTYLELQPGVTAGQLDQPIANLLKTHASADVRATMQAYAVPLTAYHFQAKQGIIGKLILVLTLVALFILLMAVVNFVNLATGLSTTRLREIGVRKALGGERNQLIGQFLTEALLLAGGASLLAVAGYELARPLLTNVLGKAIPSVLHWSPVALGGLLLLTLCIGLLAGWYPAVMLSGQPAVSSLRGRLAGIGGAGIGLRRVLVGFQFTVAIFVFVGALAVSEQVAYFFATDLGYQKAQVLTVSSVPRDWSAAGVARLEGIRDQLRRIPGVEQVSISYEIPDGSSSGSVSIVLPGQGVRQAVSAKSVTTDEQYARTYGLKLVAGQFYRTDGKGYDSLGIVLNEAATKALGWKKPAQAIGQTIRFRDTAFRVGGVLRDFHFGPLTESIQPLVFTPVSNDPIYRYLSFRIAPGRLAETLPALQQAWSRLLPDAPFTYTFMDDTVRTFYRTEVQLQQAGRLATGLALLITLLGVVGLVSLSVARRTKEIGVRKVLGASVPGVISLFVGEYAGVLVTANAIAWPLTYLLVSNWLAQYAYHRPIGWVPFAAVGIGLALLTGLIISVQVLKAARQNPVVSLRAD